MDFMEPVSHELETGKYINEPLSVAEENNILPTVWIISLKDIFSAKVCQTFGEKSLDQHNSSG